MIVGTAFHSNKKAAILRGKMDEGGSLDEQYSSVGELFIVMYLFWLELVSAILMKT